MPRYPSTDWTTSRIVGTVFAGLVPFIIVAGSLWLRMPRAWMRNGQCCSPDWLLWGLLFVLSLIWVLLGISLPIALEGVDPGWYALPLVNLVVALLPFVFFPLETSSVTIIASLVLSVAVLLQYAIGQHSWVASICTVPYILLLVCSLWLSWRRCGRKVDILTHGNRCTVLENTSC